MTEKQIERVRTKIAQVKKALAADKNSGVVIITMVRL